MDHLSPNGQQWSMITVAVKCYQDSLERLIKDNTNAQWHLFDKTNLQSTVHDYNFYNKKNIFYTDTHIIYI